jgi:hypothetical protein
VGVFGDGRHRSSRGQTGVSLTHVILKNLPRMMWVSLEMGDPVLPILSLPLFVFKIFAFYLSFSIFLSLSPPL